MNPLGGPSPGSAQGAKPKDTSSSRGSNKGGVDNGKASKSKSSSSSSSAGLPEPTPLTGGVMHSSSTARRLAPPKGAQGSGGGDQPPSYLPYKPNPRTHTVMTLFMPGGFGECMAIKSPIVNGCECTVDQIFGHDYMQYTERRSGVDIYEATLIIEKSTNLVKAMVRPCGTKYVVPGFNEPSAPYRGRKVEKARAEKSKKHTEGATVCDLRARFGDVRSQQESGATGGGGSDEPVTSLTALFEGLGSQQGGATGGSGASGSDGATGGTSPLGTRRGFLKKKSEK